MKKKTLIFTILLLLTISTAAMAQGTDFANDEVGLSFEAPASLTEFEDFTEESQAEYNSEDYEIIQNLGYYNDYEYLELLIEYDHELIDNFNDTFKDVPENEVDLYRYTDDEAVDVYDWLEEYLFYAEPEEFTEISKYTSSYGGKECMVLEGISKNTNDNYVFIAKGITFIHKYKFVTIMYYSYVDINTFETVDFTEFDKSLDSITWDITPTSQDSNDYRKSDYGGYVVPVIIGGVVVAFRRLFRNKNSNNQQVEVDESDDYQLN